MLVYYYQASMFFWKTYETVTITINSIKILFIVMLIVQKQNGDEWS